VEPLVPQKQFQLTVSPKNVTSQFPYLHQISTDFLNSDILRGKFAAKWLLNVLPHFNCILGGTRCIG